jgi:cytoskeletal protein RodZ
MALVLERSDLAAFGAFLRDARERRGKTLQQIASETRIPQRHLDALEQGRLDQIPGGMYRRAEVRAFADAVGLDRGEALAHLEHVLENKDAFELPKVRDPLPEPRRRGWVVVTTLALLAAAALWAGSRWEAQSAQIVDEPRPAQVVDGPAVSPAPIASAEAPQPAPPSEPPATPAPVASAEPAAEPTPPPTDLALTVSSSPEGARVLLDGIARGRTPLTIRHLEPGERRLRVVLDGFVSSESVVDLTGRSRTSVHIELPPAR